MDIDILQHHSRFTVNNMFVTSATMNKFKLLVMCQLVSVMFALTLALAINKLLIFLIGKILL